MPQWQPDLSGRLNGETYQEHILQGVSRTFALTIPQLPPGLRQPVSNAYLLCRIADTIEDEPALRPEQKRYFSQEFIKVVAGKVPPETFAQEFYPFLSEHASEAEIHEALTAVTFIYAAVCLLIAGLGHLLSARLSRHVARPEAPLSLADE